MQYRRAKTHVRSPVAQREGLKHETQQLNIHTFARYYGIRQRLCLHTVGNVGFHYRSTQPTSETQQLNVHTFARYYGIRQRSDYILWEKLGFAVTQPNLPDQMQYRRAKTPGGTYFFTVVTYQRCKILCEPDNVTLLREIFRSIMTNHPFTIDAIVILPEHLHCIWTLPENDCDFSTRWRLIKSEFSRRCHLKYKQQPTTSRRRKQEQAIWQRRFWEHVIRDERDFTQHVEYIHYNPVKHGLVRSPKDWKHSSFHRYVREGLVDVNWGEAEEIQFVEGIGNE